MSSNYDIDDNRGPEIFAVITMFLVLCSVTVSLRCYVRLRLTKSFRLDDWFMLLSLVVFMLLATFIYLALHYGMGRHIEALTIPNAIAARKWQSLTTLIYIANTGFVKLSIALFLIRITVERLYTYILKTSIAVLVLWTTAQFILDLFQCIPVERQWVFTMTTGTCVTRETIVTASYTLSALAITSDLLYALLPMFMIWNMRMSIQAKITVICALGLGIFASLATIVRVRYLNSLISFDDILYTTTDALIWTITEPAVGMIAASIVTLRPLLQVMNVPGFSSTNNAQPTNTFGHRFQRRKYNHHEELETLESTQHAGSDAKLPIGICQDAGTESSEVRIIRSC